MTLPDDDKLKDFVQKDGNEHPECRYSSSTSKECSSVNGNFSCETIRRIFRNCPGSRPEKIYENSTRDSGKNSPGGGKGRDGGGGDVPSVDGRWGNPGQNARHPGWAPVFPQQSPEVFGQDGLDEFVNKVEKHFKSFFEENATPGFAVNGPRGTQDATAWKPKPGPTTPDLPPPHKGHHSKGDSTAPGGSVVEQA